MLCLAQKDERYKNEKTKKSVLLTAPLAQGGGDVRPIARPKLLDQFQKLGVLLQGELSEIRSQEIVVPGSNLVGVKVCSLNSILLAVYNQGLVDQSVVSDCDLEPPCLVQHTWPFISEVPEARLRALEGRRINS